MLWPTTVLWMYAFQRVPCIPLIFMHNVTYDLKSHCFQIYSVVSKSIAVILISIAFILPWGNVIQKTMEFQAENPTSLHISFQSTHHSEVWAQKWKALAQEWCGALKTWKDTFSSKENYMVHYITLNSCFWYWAHLKIQPYCWGHAAFFCWHDTWTKDHWCQWDDF